MGIVTTLHIQLVHLEVCITSTQLPSKKKETVSTEAATELALGNRN